MWERVLSSGHGIMATTIAGFGGLFTDAFLGKYGFIATLVIALFILFLGFLKEWKLQRLYQNENIPVPVVISIDDNTPVELLFNSLLQSIAKDDPRFEKLDEKLERYFNISSRMLTFKYDGDMYDNERLVSFLQIIRYVLNDVQSRLEHKAEFHVLYLRRPAFGVALGGMFRTDGIVVYQNNDYANRVDRVANITSRKYKEKIDVFRHFDITEEINDSTSKKLMVVVQISSHNVSVDHPTLSDYPNVIKLVSHRNGTIPPDKESLESDLWVEHAQEIYNVINRNKGAYEEIALVHSMPEAIGVILGMALENYWNIDVYQFDSGAYRVVINLKKIKYYF